MVWVRDVFLKYEDGGETSFLFMSRGRNVFPKYELGAKRLNEITSKLTLQMARYRYNTTNLYEQITVQYDIYAIC